MTATPMGWETAVIGDLCTLINGRAFKPTDWTTSGLPIVRIQNLKDAFAPLNHFDGDVREQFLIDSGELLFAWSGTPGTSFGAHIWDRGPAVLNQHIFRVLFDESHIDKQFLRSAINERVAELIGRAHGGVGLAHVTKGVFESTRLLVPPLAEQRRIVAKLDALTARTARARADLDRIPALAVRYKQAILAKAFSGELTRAETPDEAAIQSVALPPAWRWETVEALASEEPRAIQSGPFGSNLLHSEFQSEGCLVVGIDNVQDGYFSCGSSNRISDSKFKDLEKYRARPLDVVITVMATVGRTCVLPADIEPAIITKHVYRISVNRELVDPFYLMNALRGSEAVLEQMGANVRGQTRPGINGGILKTLRIPLAPIAEQREIVRRIDQAFAEIDRLTAEAAAARRLLERLDQAVLAKAFRGELVPQDPADEPASALLARIRAGRAEAPKPRRGRRALA